MKFSEIPQFTRDGNYSVHQDWTRLEDWIERHATDGIKLVLDPDYQRGHVWTEKQQREFVEFSLRGGKGSNTLKFNCPGWMNDFRGPLELVDGKQRLESVRKFLRNELRVFGTLFSEFEDELRWSSHDFIVMVNDLPTRAEVLQWYLEINSGGVVHTEEELARVRILLANEEGA